jgi:hypothetical protein
MPSGNYRSGLALATLVVALSTGCSQSNTPTSSLPNARAASAVRSSQNTSMAPQAKAMLSLIHGSNHAVIPAPAGVAALFAPVRPDTAKALYDSMLVNSLGKPYSNISSLGFACCQADEFGDAMSLTKTNARVTKVSVVLSSWGCESGFWNTQNCQTTNGTTFVEPVTLTIYAVSGDTTSGGRPEPGQVLLQQTESFSIPYRPSFNPKCANTGYGHGGFIGRFDRDCDEGLSHIISFNTRPANLTVPKQVIVTVAYNTSTSGYNPYGTGTTCFNGPGGCGYDALNVSAEGDGGYVGSALDSTGVQVYFTGSEWCGGSPENPNLTLQDDYPCWTGFHPGIAVYTAGTRLN